MTTTYKAGGMEMVLSKKLTDEEAVSQRLGRTLCTPKTAGYEYLVDKEKCKSVESDSRYVGYLDEPDSVILLFDDGSAASLLKDGFTKESFNLLMKETLRKVGKGTTEA